MGFAELLVLLVIVLLFFGAGKLPAIGEGLGRAVRGFKDAVREKTPPEPPASPKELPAPPGREEPRE